MLKRVEDYTQAWNHYKQFGSYHHDPSKNVYKYETVDIWDEIEYELFFKSLKDLLKTNKNVFIENIEHDKRNYLFISNRVSFLENNDMYIDIPTMSVKEFPKHRIDGDLLYNLSDDLKKIGWDCKQLSKQFYIVNNENYFSSLYMLSTQN